MPRLRPELKKEIIKQIKDGVSLNKISRRYSIYKSTLYYYYKKIKGKRYISPYVKPNFSEIEGEIVGIFAGDGSQYFAKSNGNYQVNVHFGGKNISYAFHVKTIFENFFRKKFRLQRESLNRLRLRTCSKDIFHYFKNYLHYDRRIKHSTVKLISISIPLAFKIGFVRGIFDTDGSLRYYTYEKGPRAIFTTTSKQLANQINGILSEFSIKCSLRIQERVYRKEKPCYYIYIWKDSVDRFINIFHPHKARIQ